LLKHDVSLDLSTHSVKLKDIVDLKTCVETPGLGLAKSRQKIITTSSFRKGGLRRIYLLLIDADIPEFIEGLNGRRLNFHRTGRNTEGVE